MAKITFGNLAAATVGGAQNQYFVHC
jgi:hypothetical protein